MSRLHSVSPTDDIVGGPWAAMALAPLCPQHAREQPILRFADTVVGAAVGVAAAWLMRRVPGGPA